MNGAWRPGRCGGHTVLAEVGAEGAAQGMQVHGTAFLIGMAYLLAVQKIMTYATARHAVTRTCSKAHFGGS